MGESIKEQIEKLRTALTTLEAQRAILGDAIEPAIAATRMQLETLEAQAAPLPPAEERRLITILFTDIVGSTALAETLDPEEWRHTVANLHATVGNIIAAHGGTVAQYLGDGLLAFFGAQDTGEEDAENAIRAALEFQTAIGNFKNGHKIQIRVGINTGLVVVGELGAEAHKEFTATGDAMNLAARLQSAATPGGVLISDDTYRYVRGVFDVTPQPPLTVKGKREPLATFLVRRAKPRAFRATTRGVSGIQTRTIGREKELEQLRAAYLDAYENRRVVWAQLVGEAGVGKSRLMQETDDWIELRDEVVRAFRGRAFAGEQNQPFALIRRMWFDRFQIAEDAQLAQAEARWVTRFREQTGIADEEPAHVLGLLVGLPFEASSHIGAMRNDPQQVKGRAFVVSRQALRAIRATTPIQMMFEDLHWADTSSLDYMRQVILEDDGTGVTNDGKRLEGMFVLASSRPEWKGLESLLADTAFASSLVIPLAPLSERATRQLAEELLENVRDVPANVSELIVERAEGIPYFAEEMVNYFIDRGIIDKTRDPWRFVQGRLSESPLPTTLQHLLLTRLGALSDTERAALQRGAIFGRNFWTGGIQALGVPEGEMVLEPLQPRGFVESQPDSALEGEHEWSFHHALLREVTYESVLKRERAALHKKAADWLEAQAVRAGRLDEFAALLGEHAEKAGDLNAAADWYVRAGEGATAQGAPAEAKHFFDRALDLLPPVDKERRWRALVGRELVLQSLIANERQSADIDELLALAEELDDDARRAEAVFRQGRALAFRGEARASAEKLKQTAVLAKRVGNVLLETRARSLMAMSLGRAGEWQDALQQGEALLAELRALDDDAALATSLSNLGALFAEAGDLARSNALTKEAAERAERRGDLLSAAVSLGNLGYNTILFGQYKQARTMLEQALSLAQAVGAERLIATTRQNLGLAYVRLGDGREARRVLDESLVAMAAADDAFGRAGTCQYLGYELERSGDFAGAARRYQEALELFSSVEARDATQDAIAGLARCAFAQGQLDVARTQATKVWQYLSEHGTSGIEFPTRVYWTCADIFDALGETESARAAVEAGYWELLGRADKITDLEWRESFLGNVTEHRAMIELWERGAL